MAFWNCKKRNVDPLVRTVLDLRTDVENLRHDVAGLLHDRVIGQPVPTNVQPHAGSVQEVLPIVDRFQELLLVSMGNADLAQAFGTYARQRELRASEEQPDTAWTEPGESTYENI